MRACIGRRLRPGLGIVLAVALVAAPGCGGDESTGDDGATDQGAADAQRWEGTFESSFGELTFTADGDQVSGTYELCDGRLEGTASGSELSGEWTETVDACPPLEQRSSKAFTGTFEFELSEDGESFSGTWAYESGDTDPNGDTWEGRRISGEGAAPSASY